MGGFFTLILFMTVILYGSNKATELFQKENPVVNTVQEPEAIDTEEVINLGESNFRFAFRILGKFADS